MNYKEWWDEKSKKEQKSLEFRYFRKKSKQITDDKIQFIYNCEHRVNINEEIEAICSIVRKHHNGVDLNLKVRTRAIVTARQIAQTLSSKLTSATLANIGYLIGKKDHCTVLHSVSVVSDIIETDKAYAKKYAKIESECVEKLHKMREKFFSSKSDIIAREIKLRMNILEIANCQSSEYYRILENRLIKISE